MTEQYNEAVAWVEHAASYFVSGGQVDLPQMSFEELTVRTELGVLWDDEYGYRDVSPTALEELLQRSHTDPAANFVARHVAADAFRFQRDAPEQLRIFGSRIILGLETPPKFGPHRRSWLRQEFLLVLSAAVTERFKLRVSRNAEAKNKTSACDAVADGLAAAGYHTSYRAVQEICLGTGEDAARLREQSRQYHALLAERNMRHPLDKFFVEADRRRYGEPT